MSRAMVWSETTKRLIYEVHPGEAMLAMVSLYLCLKDVCLLIGAPGRPDIPHDGAMRADCPVDVVHLKKLRDRLKLFRNQAVHISDDLDDGREFRFSWSVNAPFFIYESTVGKKEFTWDSITRPEIEALLADLDPWIHRHWERMIEEERRERDREPLRAKIETVLKPRRVST